MPGMPAMPSLSFGSGAGGGSSDTGMSSWGSGDWSVNVAGSGQAMQGAGGGVSPWLIAGGLAVAVGALWYVMRK